MTNARYTPEHDVDPLDLQRLTLEALGFLLEVRATWPGCLIVCSGVGPFGSALSLAANLSGAGCLLLDEREDFCRQAMRSGAADFLVKDVGEALRILKNEIRKHQPCSVAVPVAEAAAVDELIDRGVLPELFAVCDRPVATALGARAVRAWEARGSAIVHFSQGMNGSSGLQVYSFAFASALDLKAFDERLGALIPAGDSRRRWLCAAPRLFSRARTRTVQLTAGELAALAS